MFYHGVIGPSDGAGVIIFGAGVIISGTFVVVVVVPPFAAPSLITDTVQFLQLTEVELN